MFEANPTPAEQIERLEAQIDEYLWGKVKCVTCGTANSLRLWDQILDRPGAKGRAQAP